MNEQDKKSWELFYRGLAMVGYLMNGDYTAEEIPALATKLGRATMDYEDEIEIGIVAAKPKRRTKSA